MNIVTNELTAHTHNLILTEIMFFVVSAKTVKSDLIRLKIKREQDASISEKAFTETVKILKSLKRRKLIQLFVTPADFETRSTETAYLLNKYPTLPEEFGDDTQFIIKL